MSSKLTICSSLPRHILLSLALPALLVSGLSAAPPQVGPATPVCAQPADDRDANLPAVAFDGDATFLVVWQQGTKYFGGPDPTVLAARVSIAGEPLDEQPIVLAARSGAQERPRVAMTQGHFIVVWQDFHNGEDWDIIGVRVTATGKVLDRQPLLIAGGAGSQAMPDIVTGECGTLVGWQTRMEKYYEPRVALLSPTGTPAPTAGLPIMLEGTRAHGGNLQLAAAGEHWYACWRDDLSWRPAGVKTDFLARLRIDSGQAVATGGRFPKGMYDYYPNCLIASQSRVFLTSGGSQRSTRIAKGAIFDAATGEPLANPNDDSRSKGGSGWDDSLSILLLSPLVPGYAPPLGLGCSGEEFMVAVRERGSDRPNQPAPSPLRLLRIDADGRRLDDVANLPVLDDGQIECSQPAVCGTGSSGYLVAYRSGNDPGKVRIIVRKVSK